ncbi:hypothetical protein V8E36_001669 [Tilletia maclaganii]
MQKEQVYLTFGSFAAHVQTHFWNAQESYFDYDDQCAPPLIDHDVSFRAGIGTNGIETFLPRALLFDLREEFGTLRNVNQLYGAFGAEDEAGGVDEGGQPSIQHSGASTVWGDSVEVLYTGPHLAPSRYQHALEQGEEDDANSDLSASDDDGDPNVGTARSTASTEQEPGASSSRKAVRRGRRARRYWSDYARVPYHPRSLIRVGAGSAGAWSSGSGSDTFLRPMRGMINAEIIDSGEDAARDCRQRFESYEQGHRVAKQLEKDHEVAEDNLRWFVEDSDSLQAFNMMTTSSDAFSGFSACYAEALRDEYGKTDLLLWATEWGDSAIEAPSNTNKHGIDPSKPRTADDLRLARIRRMNQALSSAYLSEYASLYVPLTLPEAPITDDPTSTTGPSGSAVHVNPRSDVVNRLLQTASEAQRKWNTNLRRARWDDMWHSAAFLAAHVETSTLPSRLRHRPESIPQLTARLNWRQNTRIGLLGGCMPTPLLAPIQSQTVKEFDPIEAMLVARGLLAKSSSSSRLGQGKAADSRQEFWTPEFGRKEVDARWVDFAAPVTLSSKRAAQQSRPTSFAQSITARDADAGARIPNTAVVDAWSGVPPPLGVTHFVPLAYNITPSHPQFFNDLTPSGRALPDPDPALTNKRVRSLPLISSLSTGPSTASTLLAHRRFIQDVVRGHVPLRVYGVGAGTGGAAGAASSEDNEGCVGGKDGLREVLERFEELLQGYEGAGAAGEAEDDDGRGTDEEWGNDGEAWELDLEN